MQECRTVKRKPEDEQWNVEAVRKSKGLPWKMTPEETKVVAAGPPIRAPKAAAGLPRSGVQAADPGTPRRQYLLKATIVKKYGATKGCPGCATVGRAHTEACRERLERLYNEEQAEVKKLQKEIDAVRDQLEE